MQLGFLIDHRRCIGCHACTVACKAENHVPVGSFRTWVKYQETGTFPDVRRSFGVMRCNHCTEPPCVDICPVSALDKSTANGIVDLDRDICIGCRACMQACPYDALYLNEDRGTVEKCHFCAHRVEVGLPPACVLVCPEQAIIHGDLHQSDSLIAGMIEDLPTEVRRPEQNTGPNVHYLGHDPVLLQPGAAERPPTYLWSDRPPWKDEPWPEDLPLAPDTKVVLDAGHKVEWGTGVAAYLVTKGLGAGAAMLAPFVAWFGMEGLAARYLPEILALVFTTVTTILLVEDLHRPKLFYTLLTRGNWKSWLVKGAWILMGFSGLSSLILACHWFGADDFAAKLRWINVPLGLGAAGYTAFLFQQCEGRDLWQGKWLLPHLLAQAVLCGAACFLVSAPASQGLQLTFLVAALLHLGFGLLERHGKHSTSNARQAAAFLGALRMGPFLPFRDGLVLGTIIAGVLCVVLPPAAFVAALVGLFLYEWAYVRAAQLPPLS